MEIGMKIINVGLSVLISMGLAISPIHANEYDATDESNEQSVVNNDDTSSNEEVDSNSETVQVQSISVSTDDNTTEYSLDENEVKNIKLVVTKIFTDGHTEQTTDYQYDIYGTSSNLYLSNASGLLQNNVTYKGSDNEISVTKTAKDNSGQTISCVVTVTNKLKNLTLNEKELDLKGKTEKKLNVTLTPNDADSEKLTWTSSNEGVVKVSEDGTLTTVSCGEAIITVSSESGLKDSCKVKVSHDWILESKLDATAENEGKNVYRCSLCNETKEETIPKLTGKWVTDSHGKWYKYSNGTYENSGFKQIDNHAYYFQSNGYVQVGWLLLNNDWYMFDSEGVMITGWNGSYYFDENGKMMKNAFTPDHYYVGSSGAYLTNCWFKHDGKD